MPQVSPFYPLRSRSSNHDILDYCMVHQGLTSYGHRWNRYRRPAGPVRSRSRFQTGRFAFRPVSCRSIGRLPFDRPMTGLSYLLSFFYFPYLFIISIGFNCCLVEAMVLNVVRTSNMVIYDNIIYSKKNFHKQPNIYF